MRSHYELEMEEHDKHITWMTKNGGFAKDLTVRDHYAGLAMQVLKDYIYNFEELSKQAYEMADAMIAAREAK